jgi:hypothetical protein
MQQSSTPGLVGVVTTGDGAGAVPAWTCLACRWSNLEAVDVCAGCQRRFIDQFETSRPLVSPRLHSVVLGARELGVVFVLLISWRLATGFSLTHSIGAFSRGRTIWQLERALHLPSEAWVQRGVLAHPVVVKALDFFYLSAHLGGLAIFLLWLFLAHRASYSPWRNVVVGFTAVALAIQMISIAPPRLVPGLGMVDTAVRYHQSAYTGLGSGFTDQVSTMPSIHVGWAVIIAVAVISVSHSRYRWWVIAHPVLTVYVVVATANHFWLDAVAAIAIVGLVLAAQAAINRCRSPREPNHLH